MKRRALISVTDKTGIVEFGRGLAELGFEILSTGGTFRVLQEAGVPAEEVADYTGFPEMMDGRVKTLHPKVHGGLLARRGHVEDEAAMAAHGIDRIDVVAVNLYRFRETVRREGVTREQIVENIDIGGPSMLRSAAKNHASVAVVVDPADYAVVLDAMRAHDGALPQDLARELAGKAYSHTAAYDTAISRWFADESARERGGARHPAAFLQSGQKVQDLRYGENPHQHAALYADPDHSGPGLAQARQLSGKELSFNNILDLDAALGLALEFDEPAFVIVKHNNPCGTATAGSPVDAFIAALDADPLSAYGGIVATNRPLDLSTAEAMVERGTFVEAVVAPSVQPEALAKLGEAKWGKNVRVLELCGLPVPAPIPTVRMVSGGFLVQDLDARGVAPAGDTVPTQRAPSSDEAAALEFAWKVCKHVKSNAIVLARREPNGACVSVGVGAGQMSRVDSVQIAVQKAGDRAKGAVLASDAFFPFADGLEAAIAAGVTAAVQPGGSKRDDEVVAAADAAGLAMRLTGVRHFRH
ncbi:MAG: bifunctional phosphoribosylaminoimidazolecarboxamide formyltransferase/IMP cyclohydrolase [Planctomycetota bacterium]|nr:bifunctional phosphoribosylaminoimidazolecarboxamide formyltransferase/IMP cyclohydrolase [Planctomycetota bacterium]